MLTIVLCCPSCFQLFTPTSFVVLHSHGRASIILQSQDWPRTQILSLARLVSTKSGKVFYRLCHAQNMELIESHRLHQQVSVSKDQLIPFVFCQDLPGVTFFKDCPGEPRIFSVIVYFISQAAPSTTWLLPPGPLPFAWSSFSCFKVAARKNGMKPLWGVEPKTLIFKTT